MELRQDKDTVRELRGDGKMGQNQAWQSGCRGTDLTSQADLQGNDWDHPSWGVPRCPQPETDAWISWPTGNPIVALLLFLHSLCFDNEMIVWILQEEIISMGTEPVLVQKPCFARAKTSEVTDKLPTLENLWQTSKPPGKLCFAGWLILKDNLC